MFIQIYNTMNVHKFEKRVYRLTVLINLIPPKKKKKSIKLTLKLMDEETSICLVSYNYFLKMIWVLI